MLGSVGIAAHVFDAQTVETVVSASTGQFVVVLDTWTGPVAEFARRLTLLANVTVVLWADVATAYHRVNLLRNGISQILPANLSTVEFIAHIEAIRRDSQKHHVAAEPAAPANTFGLDSRTRTLVYNGNSVELTRTEFEIFETLVRPPVQVWSRAELMEAVWGPDWFGAENVLDTHVSHLRKKLDQAGLSLKIKTVRGIGYRVTSSEKPDRSDNADTTADKPKATTGSEKPRSATSGGSSSPAAPHNPGRLTSIGGHIDLRVAAYA